MEQKATASMERDENYIPHTRSSFNLPKKKLAKKVDYSEAFEETPLATVYRLLIQQFLCVPFSTLIGVVNPKFPVAGGFIWGEIIVPMIWPELKC